MKKNILAAILCCLAISFGGCKSMDKELKAIEGKDGVFAIMETSKGSIVLELFYDKTPLTVINFAGLSEGTLDAAKGKPFYDGLTFHRVIEDFMIQGGDPEGTGRGGPGYRFADECLPELTFDKPGYLAMANAGPGTNGSQFFITHVPTDWLNGKHTIFGQVVNAESQAVVNKVAQGDKIVRVLMLKSLQLHRLILIKLPLKQKLVLLKQRKLQMQRKLLKLKRNSLDIMLMKTVSTGRQQKKETVQKLVDAKTLPVIIKVTL